MYVYIPTYITEFYLTAIVLQCVVYCYAIWSKKLGYCFYSYLYHREKRKVKLVSQSLDAYISIVLRGVGNTIWLAVDILYHVTDYLAIHIILPKHHNGKNKDSIGKMTDPSAVGQRDLIWIPCNSVIWCWGCVWKGLVSELWKADWPGAHGLIEGLLQNVRI